MTTTLPLTVTAEAQEHILAMGLEKPYQKMLDHIPTHFPDALAIAVDYTPQYDAGGDGWIVFQVSRPDPLGLKDTRTGNGGLGQARSFQPMSLSISAWTRSI